MKKLLLIVVIAASCLPCAYAQTFVDPNVLPNATSYSDTSLGNSEGTLDPATSSLGLQFTVEAAEPSLSFDGLVGENLVFPDQDITQYFTTGFNSVTSYTTTINFNSLSLTYAPVPNYGQPLTPANGYTQPTYNVSSYGGTSGTANLSGSYTVAGPTDSASGTFSLPVDFSGYLGGGTLSTGDYPDSLTLNPAELVLQIFPENSSTLFSVSVDGRTIAPTLGELEIVTSGSVVGVPGSYGLPIPEPRTDLLLLVGLSLGLAVRVRRILVG